MLGIRPAWKGSVPYGGEMSQGEVVASCQIGMPFFRECLFIDHLWISLDRANAVTRTNPEVSPLQTNSFAPWLQRVSDHTAIGLVQTPNRGLRRPVTLASMAGLYHPNDLHCVLAHPCAMQVTQSVAVTQSV